MPQITGIQRREPYRHSASSFSSYNHLIAADELNIKKQSGDKIQILFKRTSHRSQGVGLTLPSTEVGLALGKTLSMVVDGHTTDITISI